MTSRFAREAGEAAAGARRQIAVCATPLADLASRLRNAPPVFVATCARGSSDHAATYGKYLLETSVGCAVASLGPSIASIYARGTLALDRALVIAVSQSGKSRDVLQLAAAARRRGALVVGLVNDETSPLAGLCEVVLPLCAGEERSVAATKSFLLSGFALLQLVAAWTGDPALAAAVARAPDAFEASAALDWSTALAPLADTSSLYVIGRGVGLGPALELALKLKETCGLHAEAFSAAEILHGPVALVGSGFPVIALGQADETVSTTRDVVARLGQLGARIWATPEIAGASCVALPIAPGVPAVVAPLCAVQSAYAALPALAAARGWDIDAPRHLAKITDTL